MKKNTINASDALIQAAVLKSLEIGTTAAATVFGFDEGDLAHYQEQYIDQQYALLHPASPDHYAPATPPNTALDRYARLQSSVWFRLTLRVLLAVLLLLICYGMPYILEGRVDPVTGTLVWLLFTSALIMVFGGLVLDLVLFVQHYPIFQFRNPFDTAPAGPGEIVNDYYTLLGSDHLTAYEKCVLVQRKYLSLLFAWVGVVLSLAILTHG